MRVRWQHGFATRIVWHGRTELRQRDAHNAADDYKNKGDRKREKARVILEQW